MELIRNSVVALLLTWLPISHAAPLGDGAWEFFPGFKGPGAGGMHVGDFDGDGHPEILVAGSGFDGFPEQSQRYAVLSSTAPDRHEIRSITVYPGRLVGTTIAWTPPGGITRIAALVESEFQRWIVVMSGVPLRIERVLPAPMVQTLGAVADLGDDGDLEMVVLSGPSWLNAAVTVLSVDSGLVEWTSPHEGLGVAVGQLDADTPLEIVLAGTPGRVLDGLSGAIEWTYPSGLGDRVMIGRFGDDPTKNAIAASFFEHVTLFNADPYSPVREVLTGRGAVAKTERLEDGGDLLARGSVVFDLRTGAAAAGSWEGIDEVGAVVVTDIDSDGTREIVFSDGLGHTGADRLFVRDLDENHVELRMLEETGPHSAIAYGDVAGNGQQRVVFSTAGTPFSSYEPFQSGPKLRTLDVASGELLTIREDLFTGNTFLAPTIALAQLDADPALEIILTGDDYFSHNLMAVDGATLQTQWLASERPPGEPTLVGLSMVDVNADIVKDVVAITIDGRIAVHDGRTGDLLWYSVQLLGGSSGRIAAHVDAGTPTAIVSRGNGLYAFNLITRLLVDVRKTDAEILEIGLIENSDSCRVGALLTSDVIRIYSCDGFDPIATWHVPPKTTFFRLVRQGSAMLIAADGILFVLPEGGMPQPVSEYLGNAVGSGNQGVLVAEEASGAIDVIIGSSHRVIRIRIPADTVFSGNFDPQ